MKRLFTLKKHFEKSLGLKISLPLIFTTIIFLITIILVNHYLFVEYGKRNIKQTVESKMKEIENNLQRVEAKAVWISSICSEMTLVKNAYKSYYETNDLESSSRLIEAEFSEINNSILKNTNEKAKIHFHLPPAKSFLRCWSSKRGDDISGFRNTVLDVSKNQTAIKGIEVGRAGFVIRGIIPIFGAESNYLGSVETLFPISSIVKDSKLSETEEFAIFMHTDLLEIASKFLEKNATNINIEEETIGKLILVEKTSNNFQIQNLPKVELQQGLIDTVFFEKDNFQYVVFPIFNYSNKAEGVGVIQINRNDILASIEKAKMINLFFGVIFVLLLIVLVFYFTKILVTNPVNTVVIAMGKMSQKQINFRMKENRSDEIGELYGSINEMNKVFTEMIVGIDETASAVLSASNQLSNVSLQISERANEQASTNQEIATSMEQMLATINSNTEQAKNTGIISSKSSDEMLKGNTIFLEIVKSITEISEKINLINEIASKTDILSINAAIEAARAGSTGKGFAVVAFEIRKLADKTKYVSDEITALSVNGQDISKVAKETLERVIPDITRSAKLVENIVTASKEQQGGVEMINSSIQQLTAITNKNSASAEEMSASAEDLSIQAKQLKKIIASSASDILNNKNVNLKKKSA